jgi:hypothetical protein
VISTNLAHTASILRRLSMADNGETVPQFGKARQYPRTLTDSASTECQETIEPAHNAESNCHSEKLWTGCEATTVPMN